MQCGMGKAPCVARPCAQGLSLHHVQRSNGSRSQVRSPKGSSSFREFKSLLRQASTHKKDQDDRPARRGPTCSEGGGAGAGGGSLPTRPGAAWNSRYLIIRTRV